MRYVLMAALMAGAVACSPPATKQETAAPVVEAPANPAQPPATFLGDTVTQVPAPAPIAAETPLWEGLKAGGAAQLALDACPTDEAFKTSKPLGTLVCGQTYTVFWQEQGLRWGVLGPNQALKDERAKDVRTLTLHGGATPDEKRIVAWGMILDINEAGEASLQNGGVKVGHLTHIGAAKK
jgi:hypothetical protein